MVTDLEEKQPAPKCLQSELVHTVESRPAGAGEEEKLPQRSPGPGTRGTAGGERELLCSKQGRKWRVRCSGLFPYSELTTHGF